MNHWSLRNSRAKDVLAVALQRHGQRDSMLKLSAQATAERLFGPSHGMDVIPPLMHQQAPAAFDHNQQLQLQQQQQQQYMQPQPQMQYMQQQQQQQQHLPPPTSTPYSSSAGGSFLLGSGAGLASEALTSGHRPNQQQHQEQLAHASMLMNPGVPTSLPQHQQQHLHHHLGTSAGGATPLSALNSIDLPESARNA